MAVAEEVAVPTINPSVKKWIVISALLGYVVLLFFLFFFIDIGKLLSVLGSVNLSIYILALISVVVSITFHALVWFQLLNSVSIKLGFRRTYVLYWVGVFVDNLIPGGWSGDLFKAYLLSRDSELDSGRAVASVVAKNVYEAIFNLGSMILGLSILLLTYDLPDNGVLFLIGGIMVLLTLPLVILLTVSFKPKGAKRILAFLIRLLPQGGKRWNLTKLQANVEKAVDDYHEGMQLLLENPRMLFKPMILSFFAWGFEVIALLLVFASLNQPIPPDKVIIVRSIAGNVEAQGYAFAGYAQIVTIGIYNALKVVPIELSTSVALLGGLVVFWLKTGISYVAFHCTIFSPCANFVCRAIGVGGVAGNKPCKTKQQGAAQGQDACSNKQQTQDD